MQSPLYQAEETLEGVICSFFANPRFWPRRFLGRNRKSRQMQILPVPVRRGRSPTAWVVSRLSHLPLRRRSQAKKNSLALSKPLSSRVVSLPTILKQHAMPEVQDNFAGIYTPYERRTVESK